MTTSATSASTRCPSSISDSSRARNPSKSVPFAVIGSILLALVIYVLLQIAYIGAVSPSDVMKGWSHFNFASPFAELALALNLNATLDIGETRPALRCRILTNHSRIKNGDISGYIIQLQLLPAETLRQLLYTLSLTRPQ